MATPYIGLPVTTDPNALVETALENISVQLPGWVPRDGNLEVLVLEQMAIMAAEAATVASNVQETIFKYYGGLVGITPDAGQNAVIETTWQLASPAASTVTYPTGVITGFIYNGATYQFQLLADLVFTTGIQTVNNVQMQAVAAGSQYNLEDVAGLNPIGTYMTPLNGDPNIRLITITAVGVVEGVDPETDTQYLNRLVAELRLLAPRPITPYDYSTFAQNTDGVYRSLTIDGYNPYLNALSAADANFTTLGTTPSTWAGVGNGNTTVSTLAQAGTSPNAYLQVTAASMPTSITVNGAQGAGTAALSLSLGSGLSAGTSASHPLLLLITGTSNSEVVVGTSVGSYGGGNQTINLITGTQFAYAGGETVTVLQGAMQSTPTSPLYANSSWYEVGAFTGRGNDATGHPIIVAVATYWDNSQSVYSSVPQSTTSLASLGLDYVVTGTVQPRLNWCVVDSQNMTNPLAPGNPASTLGQQITSIQMFMVWASATSSDTHRIYYNFTQECGEDFDIVSGLDSLASTSSFFNFAPDPLLTGWSYLDGSQASWGISASGAVALPGIGIQYTGGSPTVSSPVINLFNQTLNGAVPYSGNPKYFTFMAHIDGSALSGYTATGANSVTLQVYDLTNSAVLASAVLPATNGNINDVFVPFEALSGTYGPDVQLQVVFGSGLTIGVTGASVIVSQVSLFASPTSAGYTELPSIYQNGLSWTPGGSFNATGIFNQPRAVAIAAVDENGVAIGSSVAAQLSLDLQSHREANFTISVLTPNYVPINVSWTATAAPGWDPAGLLQAVNPAIYAFLNPAIWHGGADSPPTWDGSTDVVQAYDIGVIIGSVEGISSVTSVGLTQGTATQATASTITVTGTTAVVVTTTDHGFFNGESVTVSGTGVSGLNLGNVPIAYISPTSFSYSVQGGTSNAASGSISPTPQASIALSGAAALPIANQVSGAVSANPNDSIVGVY